MNGWLYILATGYWSVPDTTGETPKPCAAASFTKVDQHTTVLFGGRQKKGRVNDLAILNMEKWVKKWLVMYDIVNIYV